MNLLKGKGTSKRGNDIGHKERNIGKSKSDITCRSRRTENKNFKFPKKDVRCHVKIGTQNPQN